MRTPDRRRGVEIMRRGTSRWYRIVHGDDVIDWLTLPAVERLLDQAGVDRAALVPVARQDQKISETSMSGASEESSSTSVRPRR